MRQPADETAARELALWGTNTGELYFQRAKPIIVNLARKMATGNFDESRAVVAFSYWAEAAARQYAKEFSVGTHWAEMFNPATRLSAAAQALAHYREQIEGAAEDFRNAKRWSVSAIRAEHTGHFFDRKTMRFFGDTSASFGVHCEDGAIYVVRVKSAKGSTVGKRWRFNPETGAIG